MSMPADSRRFVFRQTSVFKGFLGVKRGIKIWSGGGEFGVRNTECGIGVAQKYNEELMESDTFIHFDFGEVGHL